MRHKGFIPWDDDLDVRMFRREFEKFFEVCKTQLDTKRFFLQTDQTDKEYRWGYAKIRRKGTEYIREGQEAIKCVTGVFIDIFIIDNIPDSAAGKIIYHIVRRGCIKTLWSVVGVTADPNPVKRLLYRGLRHVDKRIPLGILRWLAKMSNKKETEMVYCISFYRKDAFKAKKGIFHSGVKAEWFKDTVEIEFEGFMFYAGSMYEEYLISHYGDYWEYPPESQRYIHPPQSYCLDVDIDLRGRSVEEYMNHEYIYLTREK